MVWDRDTVLYRDDKAIRDAIKQHEDFQKADRIWHRYVDKANAYCVALETTWKEQETERRRLEFLSKYGYDEADRWEGHLKAHPVEFPFHKQYNRNDPFDRLIHDLIGADVNIEGLTMQEALDKAAELDLGEFNVPKPLLSIVLHSKSSSEPDDDEYLDENDDE